MSEVPQPLHNTINSLAFKTHISKWTSINNSSRPVETNNGQYPLTPPPSPPNLVPGQQPRVPSSAKALTFERPCLSALRDFEPGPEAIRKRFQPHPEFGSDMPLEHDLEAKMPSLDVPDTIATFRNEEQTTSVNFTGSPSASSGVSLLKRSIGVYRKDSSPAGTRSIASPRKRRYFDVDPLTGEERITEVTELPASPMGTSERRVYPVSRFHRFDNHSPSPHTGAWDHAVVVSEDKRVLPSPPPRTHSVTPRVLNEVSASPSVTDVVNNLENDKNTHLEDLDMLDQPEDDRNCLESLRSLTVSTVNNLEDTSTTTTSVVFGNSTPSAPSSPSARTESVCTTLHSDQSSTPERTVALTTTTELAVDPSQDNPPKPSNLGPRKEGKARRDPPASLSLAEDVKNFATLASSRVRRQALNSKSSFNDGSPAIPRTPIPTKSVPVTPNTTVTLRSPEYKPLPPISPVESAMLIDSVPCEVSDRIITKHAEIYTQTHGGDAPRVRRRKVRGKYRLPVTADTTDLLDFIIVKNGDMNYWKKPNLTDARDENSGTDSSGSTDDDDSDSSSATDIERWSGGNVKGPKYKGHHQPHQPYHLKQRTSHRPDIVSEVREVLEQPISERLVPEQPVPEEPVPEEPVPEEPVPEEPVPEEPVPEEPVPEQLVPEQLIPEQPVSEEPLPEQPLAEQLQPEQPVAKSRPVRKQQPPKPSALPAPEKSKKPINEGSNTPPESQSRPKSTRKLSSLRVEDEGVLTEDSMDLDYGSKSTGTSRPGSRGSQVANPSSQLAASFRRAHSRQAIRARSNTLKLQSSKEPLFMASAMSPFPSLSDTDVSSDDDIIPAKSLFSHRTAPAASSLAQQSRDCRREQQMKAIRATEGGPGEIGYKDRSSIFSIAQLGVPGLGVMGPPAAKVSLAEHRMYIGRKGDQVPLYGSGGNMVVAGLGSSIAGEPGSLGSEYGSSGLFQPGGIVEVRRVEDPLLEAVMEIKRLIHDGGHQGGLVPDKGILGGLNVEKVYWSGEREPSLTKPHFGIGVEFSGRPLIKALTFSNPLTNHTYTLMFVWGFLPVNTPEKNKENAVGNSMLLSDEVKGDGALDARSSDIRESFQVHLCVGKPGRMQKKEERKRTVFVQVLSGGKGGKNSKAIVSALEGYLKWERWELDGLMRGLTRLWLSKSNPKATSPAMRLPRTLKRSLTDSAGPQPDIESPIGMWLEREVLGLTPDYFTDAAKTSSQVRPQAKKTKSLHFSENGNRSPRMLSISAVPPVRLPPGQTTLSMYLQTSEQRTSESDLPQTPPSAIPSTVKKAQQASPGLSNGILLPDQDIVRRGKQRKDALWAEMDCGEASISTKLGNNWIPMEDERDFKHWYWWEGFMA